jgi:hypothetical protein
VSAHALVRVTVEAIPSLRRQPGPVFRAPLAASFLKHADEQTVVGLVAVLEAIHRHNLGDFEFRDWGALAAPRFLGRTATAAALHRFAREGAWGISPHLIPHCSLHALSGTVSQALKIHGPNFGVAGGPGGPGEALLAATAMLRCRQLPGVWAVLTCMDPEPIPDEMGQTAVKPDVVGLALALQPTEAARAAIRLSVQACSAPAPQAEENCSRWELDLFRLEGMLRLLGVGSRRLASAVQWRERSLRIDLSRSPLLAPLPAPSSLCPAAANGEPAPWAGPESLIASGVETGQ